MDYIDLMKKGSKLICNYNKIQEDSFMNTWTKEIWYYNKNKNCFICECEGHTFTSELNEETTKRFFWDIKDIATIEIEQNQRAEENLGKFNVFEDSISKAAEVAGITKEQAYKFMGALE